MMNNKLNETTKRLDKAYKLISGIPVTGDAVDMMALARMELRAAYAAVEEMERKLTAQSKQKGEQEGEDGSVD